MQFDFGLRITTMITKTRFSLIVLTIIIFSLFIGLKPIIVFSQVETNPDENAEILEPPLIEGDSSHDFSQDTEQESVTTEEIETITDTQPPELVPLDADPTQIQQDYHHYDGYVIKEIEVVEDYKTAAFFVRSDIGFEPGDVFTVEEMERRIQRFLNLDLVLQLIYVIEKKDDGIKLTYYVKDKWSILPVIRYSETFVTLVQVGLYDQNFLGLGHELLGNYIYRDGYHLFRAYYNVPRLPTVDLLMNLTFYGYGWSDWYYKWDVVDYEDPTDEEFEQNFDTDDDFFGRSDRIIADKWRREWDIPIIALERISYGGYINFAYEIFKDLFRVGILYGFCYEMIDYIPNAGWIIAQGHAGYPEDNKNRVRKYITNRKSGFNLIFNIGNIDKIDTFLREGHFGKIIGSLIHEYLGSTVNIYQLLLTYTGYIILFDPWVNIATRGIIAWSKSEDEGVQSKLPVRSLYDFTMGGEIGSDLTGHGFNTLRGFEQTHLHAPNLYYINLDLRITVLNEDEMPFFTEYVPFIKAWTVQLYAFLDVGYGWEGKMFDKRMFEDVYLSAGAGVLWVLKQVANFVVNPSFIYRIRPNPDWTVYFETRYFY